jgi:hypothetical protein
MRLTWEERIESLKAGTVGAVAIAPLSILTLFINQQFFSAQFPLNLVSCAIATFTGFLFGVTYRYIIREDENSHLKSGAVLSFGLIRGLGQIDIGINTQSTLLPFVALAGESVLMFAIARLCLDLALHQNWVRPFKS